jgi:hypothetical protein
MMGFESLTVLLMGGIGPRQFCPHQMRISFLVHLYGIQTCGLP